MGSFTPLSETQRLLEIADVVLKQLRAEFDKRDALACYHDKLVKEASGRKEPVFTRPPEYETNVEGLEEYLQEVAIVDPPRTRKG